MDLRQVLLFKSKSRDYKLHDLLLLLLGGKCGVDVVNRWRRLCSQLISSLSQSALSKVNGMMGLVDA